MRLLLIAMMALSCQPVTKPVQIRTITVHDTVYVYDTIYRINNQPTNIDYATDVHIGPSY